MTGSPASPMTRLCVVCQMPFERRRSDAKFCSNRCRQAGHRNGKSDPGLLVAQNVFPLDLERGNLAAAAATSWLNDISTQAALGVVFVPLRLTFDIRESFVGAVDLAEKNDQGPVGRFLRLLKSHGWMSPSPEVREALVEQTYRIRNKEIMSDTKAVLDRDNEEWRQISERKRLCASIKRGDAFLTALIAPLVEHRDIPIGTPSFIPKPASPLDLKISEPPPPRARNG
jgi:hypothetical protein